MCCSREWCARESEGCDASRSTPSILEETNLSSITTPWPLLSAMSNIDELRSKFYDDDDDVASFPSGTGTGAGSSSSTVGPSRSAGSSSRGAPYPDPHHHQARGRRGVRTSEYDTTAITSSGASSARRSGGKAGQQTSFVERLQAVANDDDSDRTLVEQVNMDVDVEGQAREGVLNRERNETDVQKLLRAWQDERHAPDILPAKDVLLGNVLDSIRRQVCVSELLLGCT